MIILIIILVGLIIVGYHWGTMAQDPGITCDIGAVILCWSWHKNIVDQTSEFIKNIDIKY